MASQDKDLHVVAEALDAIFDIFAEDDVNAIMNEIDLLDQLRKILVALKPQVSNFYRCAHALALLRFTRIYAHNYELKLQRGNFTLSSFRRGW